MNKFTRKQLYDLVWSKSLTQLAKEYNISDNGLRKICKKHNIPLPKMEHWQKVQYGKKVDVILLPKGDNEKEVQISLDGREIGGKEEHILTKITRVSKEIEKACGSILIVPEKLAKPHFLIREARDDFKLKKKSSYHGFPQSIHTDWEMISISVQKENVARALRFMNTFIKVANKRGHDVEIKDRATIIRVDGEEYNIRLRERHNRVVVSETPWRRTELVPNGKFVFKLDNRPYKEWQDGKVDLEEQLSKIIAFIEIQSVEDKEQRERWRIAQEKADIQREIERKLQAERDWEEKKAQILIGHATEWRKAKELQEFIQEVEAKSTNPTQKVKDWLKWAKEKQALLDPLSDGSESLIDKYLTPPVPPKKNCFY